MPIIVRPMIVFNFVTAEPLFSPCLLCFLLFILFPVTFPHTSQLVDVVQLLNYVRLFAPSWTAALQASLSFTISWSLLKLMSIESMVPSNHLICCCPFFSCPQFFPASGSFPVSQLFASGGQSIRALASASALPVNIQGWFPKGKCDLPGYDHSSVPFFPNIQGVGESQTFRYNLIVWILYSYILFATEYSFTDSFSDSQIFTKFTMW